VRDDPVALHDLEGVVAPGASEEDEPGGAARGLDLRPGRSCGGDTNPRGREVLRVVAQRVVLLELVAVLDQGEGVAHVRLGLGVLALVLLIEEGRKGDGGEDADDQDDDRSSMSVKPFSSLWRRLRSRCSM